MNENTVQERAFSYIKVLRDSGMHMLLLISLLGEMGLDHLFNGTLPQSLSQL
ncbi:hypothetical protein PENSUB_1701 [Penicillium subrubescens]|uniref:Uncharacterized protein n=1 Tax=Penicillium subrubescens TaxID=1316194 RepID=A0A1Q5UJD5_9EURO|nr:hypothetical protein PENSUB_1701 [Penicillium subrubescens]